MAYGALTLPTGLATRSHARFRGRDDRTGLSCGVDRFDVIVLGAGVAGSSAAYAMARDQRVLLLEQYPFLHARGSSHGGSRIFRYAYEQPQYVAMALAAEDGWRALERDEDERLLTKTGGLDSGRAASRALEGIAGALAAAGLAFEELGPSEVARRFPAFALADDRSALYQADAGILDATRSVNAFLRGAARRGADLRDREAVTAIEPAPDEVVVRTSKGAYAADRLVVTAGAWLGSVLDGLGLPLRVEQQQVLYVRTSRPADFAPPRMPVFIDHEEDCGLYGFPLFDDPVAIKLADHHNAPTIDLERRGTQLMEEWAAETIRRARSLLPSLTGELRRFDLCLYTKTPDEHFILDRHPEHPNVVIGGGFSGHGFKFGPVLGEVLRALSMGEGSAFDLSLFGALRFNAPTAPA